ncbi:MAG TPA: 1-deoxy-D-xylulose-5-phosphate reductoisomerase, partial [Chloroflexia bacterium]|nr:1-deoxy-D-xylulose-5-phosphate reductoisomerase [Chloroflexia bacterium]
FEAVDTGRFRCLTLAFEAGRLGGTYPTVLAAADEVAVPRFMAEDIRFGDIPGIIEGVLEKHVAVAVMDPDISAIKWADDWARQTASELADLMRKR